MKLSEIAKKQILIKITLDNEEIIKLYDEPVEFWMWDRQDVPVFLKMAQLKNDEVAIMNIIREIILDEKAQPMLKENEVLPIEIVTPLVTAILAHLGNWKSQTTVT
jgi:hypothetical protein